MATYKEISGFNIKSLSSDPSNLLEGEIWYNSTSGTLKVAPLVSSWASGGDMVEVRASGGSLGTQTANMAVAGYTGPTFVTTSRTYDGSTWSPAPSLSGSLRRSNAGFGTTTAAVSVGGSIGPLPPTANTVTTVEEYDGSSWTAGTAYPVGTYDLEAVGTLTAGLGCAGYTTPSDPGTYMTTNYDYNGSAWTANNTMTTARANFACTGTQTAALAAGGAPSNLVNAETYDGTNWTAITNLPTGRMMMNASGPQTQALVFGGRAPGITGTSVLWDGSSWAADVTMATGRDFLFGSSASGAGSALASGGYAPAISNSTEEYSQAITAETVTTS